MNIKNILAIVLFVALASVAGAQTLSTANEAYPLPVAISPISEAIIDAEAGVAASRTLTLSGTAQAMPTMPAGTKVVVVDCVGGIAIYGNASITSVAAFAGPTLSSGSEVIWVWPTIKAKAGKIYFIQSSAGGGGVVHFTPFK